MEEAAERIAEDRPDAANAFLLAALRAAARLVERPQLGSVRPYVPSRYRFWPLRRYSYLLVYDTMAEPVLRSPTPDLDEQFQPATPPQTARTFT